MLALAVVSGDGSRQLELYREVSTEFGAPLERLARGYERNEAERRDLLQEIHLALWRSLGSFDGRCSLRTWVYRVAHNVSITRALRGKRARAHAHVSLSELESMPSPLDVETNAGEHAALERLLRLVQRLEPAERQLMVLYLEGLDAEGIGEVIGISAANVATRVYRIKRVLARQFATEAPERGTDDEQRVLRTSGA
jgi:RNA polymerase sigma-70 factor (ECF subfamily)